MTPPRHAAVALVLALSACSADDTVAALLTDTQAPGSGDTAQAAEATPDGAAGPSADVSDAADASDATDGSDGSDGTDGSDTPDGSDGSDTADGSDATDSEVTDVVAWADASPDADAASDSVAPSDTPETPDATPSADVADVPSGADTAALVPGDPGLAGSFPVTQSAASIPLTGGLFPTQIALDLYVPNGATARPVIVLTHGFQLDKGLYKSTATHLASWGYPVVVPNLGGGFTATHVDHRDTLLTLIDWVVAQAGAPSGALAGVADAKRLVLAGHSMGGKLSLFVAADDPRPVAVMAIDPVDSAGGPLPVSPADYPSITPERMDDIDVPLLLLGETKDAAGGLGGQACAPAADNFQQYFDNAESPVAQVAFAKAAHMSWLDDPGCLFCLVCQKGEDDAGTRALMRRYLVAFMRGVVEGQTEYLDWLVGASAAPDEAAGLVARSWKNGFPQP